MGKLIFFAIIGAIFYIVVWPNLGGAKDRAFGMQSAMELERFLKDVKEYQELRGDLTTIKDMSFVRNFSDVNAKFELDQSIAYGVYLKGVFKPCINLILRESSGKKYIQIQDLKSQDTICEEFVKRPEITKFNNRYDL
jgi:hypothetical protein